MMWGLAKPCGRRDRDERLAPLVDLIGADGLLRSDEKHAKLVDHVRSCETCSAALSKLNAQRLALASLGDVEGAAPTDAGFRNVMAALSAERFEEERRRRPRAWLVLATGATAIVLAGGYGLRAQHEARLRAQTDEAIVSGAQAAFRRAEREYGDAVALLRESLRRQGQNGTIDPKVEEGARVLAEARQKAEKLATEQRADPEREALVREAYRAEVRYYEDALLRGSVPR